MRGRLAIVLLALGLAAANARAQIAEVDASAPVVMRADDVAYDSRQGIVIATGNVEVAQNDRILLADRIIFYIQTNTVKASGNVTLLEPTGEVLFAEEVELTDEMKEGVMRDIRIILTDNSRMAANGAVRSGGYRTEMRQAVYSPCNLCPDNPDAAPLWQLKAARVVHDQRRQEIEYSDVVLEAFGVPIAYTPFFSHPDPTVKRRSGFLTPTYGSSSELGITLQVPYYFNLAPNRDLTLAPIFTTDEGPVFIGEYRARTESGEYLLAGSITYPESRGLNGETIGGNEVRGHIEGTGAFRLTDVWSWGYQLDRSTDDTYLRRYNFSNEDTLTSRLYLEGIDGRNYAAINGYAFQGLLADDDSGLTPLVLPIADYNLILDNGLFGGNYTFDANLMSLSRSGGTDTRRISLDGGWHLPFLGSAGDIYTLSAQLRGDLYWVDDLAKQEQPDSSDEITGRIVPSLSLDWRYPWIRQAGTTRQIIEPIAKISVSPYGGNPDGIPNEDSQDFEFDDTNLFDLMRFPGLDRVEGGPRASYGLRMGVFGISGGRTTAFIGQSYRVKADSTFEKGSGLEDNFSDFVGRVNISPSDFVDIAYRFRLDHDDLSPRRSEVTLSGGPDWLRVNLGYLSLDDAPENLNDDVDAREEINAAARFRFDSNWSISAVGRHNLTTNNTIGYRFGIDYEDECLIFSTRFVRSFTRDRDVEPSSSILFVITLRTLG
ncbi:MAG: LPS assembly protein LptD [Alphaproteobacteria bacterium]|nr:LPS assembly protein LptD [Alphaproteobacteria bacterium]